MKCEICDKEFANSEEVKAHVERDHPVGDSADEELEKPDMVDQAERAPIVPGKNN